MSDWNPFKYIPKLRTFLQALAFVIACCCYIWIRLIQGNLEWNNRTIAIVALSLLGFASIMAVSNLSRADRPRTLIVLVFLIGAFITTIVLSVQDYIISTKNEKTVVNVFPTEQLNQEGVKALSKDGEIFNITNMVSTSGNSEDVAIPKQAEDGSFLFTSKEQLSSPKIIAETSESLIWIVPEISYPSIPGTDTEIINAPPFELAGARWEILASHVAGLKTEREWYVSGPMVISDGKFTKTTDFVDFLPPGQVVTMATVHSVKTTGNYQLPLWRPAVEAGGSSNDQLRRTTPRSGINLSHTNSILEFIRIYQDKDSLITN